MSERRRVVVTDEVLYAVDAVLLQAPTAGRPSRAQFISTDLLEAVEQFAVGWDGLAPLISGPDDYRVLISRGRLVYAFVVEGQLASDGTIELVSIELDLTGPEAWDISQGFDVWGGLPASSEGSLVPMVSVTGDSGSGESAVAGCSSPAPPRQRVRGRMLR